MKAQPVILFFALVIAALLIVSSCKKENQAPLIALKSPVDTLPVITIPDSIRIQGTLSDDAGLHEAAFVILNPHGDTAAQQYPYVHDLKAYPFAYNFFPTLRGAYILKVAAFDHQNKSTEKTVNFTVN